MVSYKRLNPENVQFSGALLSEEHHRPAQEDVAVSKLFFYLYFCD